MSIKFTTVPTKLLAQTILSTASDFKLNDIAGWDGNNLTSADFGTQAFGVFLNPTRTIMELFEFDPSTIASTSITFVGRGLPFTGGTTPVTANKLDWTANETTVLIGSDVPQLLSMLVDLATNQNIGGVKTFTSSPIVPTPTTATQAANKDYVDGVTTAGGPDASTTVKGLTRLSYSPNGTPTALTSISNASPAILTLNSHGLTLNDTIVLTTTGTLPTGLSLATTYYVISAGLTANAFEVSLSLGGAAVDTSSAGSGTHSFTLTTPVSVGTYDTRVPTQGENDALAGTSGTPSSSNKYVTNDDTSSTPSGSKAIRWSGGAYPAGDGSAITGINVVSNSYTASGNIAQNDTVYVSAANTVATLYPSAQGTGASISTSPSHMASIRPLPLSTSGLYLHVSGGITDSSAILYAQVRTINAGETDFSNGAEATVYGTGNGVRAYDVCSIGTDKYLFIFQADTAGVAAGIKAVVATVSGTTVTVGSPVTVETTGTLNASVSCAKADTDKGIIFYKDDAGNDIYMKVLSVSGTTITQNTAALLKTTTALRSISSVQLATDSVAVTYSPGSTSLFGSIITISSTTPSAGAEQTIVAASELYYHKITFISTTKLLLTYEEDSTNDTYASTVAISGATMTASSTLSLEASTTQNTWGTAVIGTKYALVLAADTSTNNKLYFLNISSTTPTTISTQNLAQTTDTTFVTTGIVKVSPWTYMCTGVSGDGDYIVKMTVVSSARIGIASSAISDTASGSILARYQKQTLSGITLTPGSLYYTDDNGQPTVNSSLTSPTIGIAISTTNILLQ